MTFGMFGKLLFAARFPESLQRISSSETISIKGLDAYCRAIKCTQNDKANINNVVQ